MQVTGQLRKRGAVQLRKGDTARDLPKILQKTELHRTAYLCANAVWLLSKCVLARCPSSPTLFPRVSCRSWPVSMESGTCICDTGLSHMCVIKFLTEGMSLKLVRPCLGLHPDSAGYRLRDPEQGAKRTWALPSGTVKEWRL